MKSISKQTMVSELNNIYTGSKGFNGLFQWNSAIIPQKIDKFNAQSVIDDCKTEICQKFCDHHPRADITSERLHGLLNVVMNKYIDIFSDVDGFEILEYPNV